MSKILNLKIIIPFSCVLVAGSVVAVAEPGSHGFGPRGLGGPERMIERLDANEDGTISEDEVNAFRNERFAKFDTDKSGGLSVQEMEAGREAEKQERRAEMLSRIDTNGDQEISLEEFGNREVRMFERLDANKDGEISAEELKSIKDKRDGKRRGR